LAGTIVYVDSKPDLPDGLGRRLNGLGFRLQHTADTHEALALVRHGVARLVMVEALIQGGRGWDLIHHIRGLERPLAEVPIVILTRGERTRDFYARALEFGVDDFLARPVQRAQVLDAILGCVEPNEPALGPVLGGSDRGTVSEVGGGLADVSVAELFLGLRDARATGVLFLQDLEEFSVQLHDGLAIRMASSWGDETFADFLLRTKRISGREHEDLLEQVHAMGESEAEAAVSIRAMSREDVQAALVDRAAEPFLDAFAWASGSWRFEHGQRLRSGQVLDRGAVKVLVQGVLQCMPSRSVRAMLDRRGALYLSKAERPPYPLQDLSPFPCEPELLNRWVGDQTVAEVLDSRVIGERELSALLIAGLVEVHDQALLELHDVLEPAPATEEAPPSLSERTQRERAAPEVASRPASRAAPRPAAASAAGSAVAQRSGKQSRADRAKDAERHFREGERHLAAKRYHQAVASFGMSSHLDPGQGDYRAHLGYALHLQNPRSDLMQREALEHIAKAIKLAPEQWKPLVYLARVFVAAGAQQNALKVLLGAVRRHPDCEPLKSELRHLQRRQSQPRPGLVARLRRWWRP
jgi:CheY-like chemotaxis protein